MASATLVFLVFSAFSSNFGMLFLVPSSPNINLKIGSSFKILGSSLIIFSRIISLLRKIPLYSAPLKLVSRKSVSFNLGNTLSNLGCDEKISLSKYFSKELYKSGDIFLT